MPIKAYKVTDNWSYILQASDMVSGNFPFSATTLNVGTVLADKVKDATVYEPYLATFKSGASSFILEIVQITAANATTGIITMVRRFNFVANLNYSVGDKLEICIPAALIDQMISGERILTNGSDVLVGSDGSVLYF